MWLFASGYKYWKFTQVVTPAERTKFHSKNAKDLSSIINKSIDYPEDLATIIEIHSIYSGSVVHPAVAAKAKRLREIIDTHGDAQIIREAFESVEVVAVQVEEAAKDLGVGTECKAIVTDGDLAAYVPTYFIDDHSNGSISVSRARKFSRFCALIMEFRALSSLFQRKPARLWTIVWDIFSLPWMI